LPPRWIWPDNPGASPKPMSSYPDESQHSPEPDRTTRRINHLVLYAVVTLGILLFTIFLVSRAQAPVQTSPVTRTAPANLPAAVGDTPTPVEVTVTPTLRPTFTPRPTGTSTITPTPTQTPTRTLSPSLTPAVPIEENEHYTLQVWTPELASRAMEILEAYPETLSTFARGEDNSGYYASFTFAMLAQREALLRLEAAPQAFDWHWRLAYNQARTGDPAAISTFTRLIAEELNADRVQLVDLYLWGVGQDPPVIIDVIPIDTPVGLLGSSLVKVSAGENGSGFFWLLESPGRFEAYPLTNDFNFIHPTQVNYFLADVTGDGSLEAGIFPARVAGLHRYALPRIFQLERQPPIELDFESPVLAEIGPDFENNWEPVPPGEGEGDLQFISDVFPPCPVTVRHIYEWNGQAFEFLEETYTLNPQPNLLSYCTLVVEHSASVWGVDTTIQLMETLLPIWPPEQTVSGDPFPADALDEWRYRLSIYHALAGDEVQARGYANSILSNPAAVGSRWVAPAQEFLEVYQSPRDIYRACLLTRFCNPRRALEAFVQTLAPEEYSRLGDVLEVAGVQVRSHGFFDFDSDGETERWLLLRHQPGGQLEFWIFVPAQEEVKALFVDFLEHDRPNVAYIESTDDPPLVQVGPEMTIQLIKQGPVKEPVVRQAIQQVVFSADRTLQALDEIEADLLTGGDPAQAREELIDLEGSSFFTCSYLLCPRFFYLLGLSNELAGNEIQAVDAYLELWRRYLGHPLVAVARLKLAGPAIPPGPTITPTPTGIRATPTRTSTSAGPVQTSTPTATSSGLQPSATPTIPVYPYP
jgi:hypothetical protein